MHFAILPAITITLFTTGVSFSQQSKIDSLTARLQVNLHDTDRVNTLISLAIEFKYKKTDTAISFIKKALVISRNYDSGAGWQKGIINSFHQLGVLNYNKGNYSITLEYFDTAITLLKKLLSKRDPPFFALRTYSKITGNAGVLHMTLGNYPKALENFSKAMQIELKLGNKNEIAKQFANTGIVYKDMGNYPKAAEQLFKAIAIHVELDDKAEIANDYISIGLIYYDHGNLFRQKCHCQDDGGNYNKALDNYFKGLKINEELNDKRREALILGNIGNVFGDMGINEKNNRVRRDSLYDKALDYYFKALKIDEESGNRDGIARHLGNIGIIYSKKGDNLMARNYYFKYLRLAETLERKNYQAIALANIATIYMDDPHLPPPDGELKSGLALAEEYLFRALALDTVLGNLYGTMYRHKSISTLEDTLAVIAGIKGQWKESAKRFKLALEHYIKYSTAKDTIFNENNSKEIGRLEVSHEYEKQLLAQDKEHEKQQALAAADLQRQKIIGYSLIAGFGLVLILAFVIYRSYRQKQKANRLLEEKNKIIEEKNKNITDSIEYASRIQEAILPSHDEIGKVLIGDKVTVSPLIKGGDQEGDSPGGEGGGFFIFHRQRDIIGGDFYFVTEVNGWKIIALADCTGHGVPGALMSMLGKDMLNEIVNDRRITLTEEVLDLLTMQVTDALNPDKTGEVKIKEGMDIGFLAMRGEELQFSGANRPLFIVSPAEEDQGIIFPGDERSIGGERRAGEKFKTHFIKTEKGMMLYMFTDGFSDQFGGPKQKKFKSSNLKKLLAEISGKAIADQKIIVEKTFLEWKKNYEQTDDVT
ncbi:MAG: tetratricopeptide repeat protein [Bacteroidetes bacterium]|nr:tetratricopeptide repeat protein [Bacteroidota bacterium]